MSPRGNDPDAAKEIQTQYGGYQNAADLIEGHKGRFNKELRAASLLDPDPVATAEANENLDKLRSERFEKATAVSASVRGGFTIAVFEPESGGGYFKEIVERPSGKAKPVTDQLGQKAPAPEPPEEDGGGSKK